MQSDRELLELAAKAAGIVIYRPVEDCVAQPNPEHVGGFAIENARGGHSLWNPLLDDGDCFRLALKLGIDFYIGDDNGAATYTVYFDPARNRVQHHGTEDFAATRRAIVKAAAEIGKQLP